MARREREGETDRSKASIYPASKLAREGRGEEFGEERREESGKRARYEITVYKLLAIFGIGLFVALSIGMLIGNHIGTEHGASTVQLPEYCALDFSSGKPAVKCNELSNVTARDLCAMLSTPLENKIRILVAA